MTSARVLVGIGSLLVATALPALLLAGCTTRAWRSSSAAWRNRRRARAPPPASTSYAPVTDQRLVDPEAENWLMYRRTYDGWGYSPLEQISPANVKNARPGVDFSTGVAEGHQAPPIVNNGVMFVSTPQNQVLALDAKSGELLWRYKRDLPEDLFQLHPTNRGVGPLRGQGLPGHARRARRRAGRQDGQGRLGPDGRGLQEGLLHDPGAADRQGQGHGRRLRRRARHPRLHPGAGRAHGQSAWKTFTIPAPGEPGSDTWKGDTWKTGGVSVWITGQLRSRSSTSPTGAPAMGPVDRRSAPRRQPLLGLGDRAGRRHRQAARLSTSTTGTTRGTGTRCRRRS